ncbi:homeobox-leucine zipper protein HAT22-like [Punica granatum]|uniref:Homeobox domain-containing protein n=2 Tax=Punica granatum TaxID=22663 RepID=A0A218X5T8_PUNGR|nr:homeobox-leucine zipper protein HAT22-like [Punica granatum]OWM80595.1 hypothetical protein CDL15_Pgr006625 [Punica granatum]PKI46947.1 hypothetical protein CRG98_032646 [Punica granatum]
MESGDACNTMLALGLGFRYELLSSGQRSENQHRTLRDRDDDERLLPSLSLGLSEAAYQSASKIVGIGMTDKYAPGEPTTLIDLTREASSHLNCSSTMKRSGERDLQEAAELEKKSMMMMISDEDEDCSTARKKLRLSKEQISILEGSFKAHSTLNPEQKEDLARQLSLRPRQVEVWFQNRRARIKLKQIEVDCESLKRRCEALREENRRLQEEVQELKSQTPAATMPLLMQIPSTTLPVMCPSCERIGTRSDDRLPTRFFSSSVTKSRLCDIHFSNPSAAC